MKMKWTCNLTLNVLGSLSLFSSNRSALTSFAQTLTLCVLRRVKPAWDQTSLLWKEWEKAASPFKSPPPCHRGREAKVSLYKVNGFRVSRSFCCRLSRLATGFTRCTTKGVTGMDIRVLILSFGLLNSILLCVLPDQRTERDDLLHKPFACFA